MRISGDSSTPDKQRQPLDDLDGSAAFSSDASRGIEAIATKSKIEKIWPSAPRDGPRRRGRVLALEQLPRFVDERSFLREKIALLERALEDACERAYLDELTGLSNRRLLEDRFMHAKARSDRHRESTAVLFLDIDGFKRVNDTHGHVAGDALLRQVAARLVRCTRTSDTVCRYGGDEFIVLLPEHRDAPSVDAATRKIRERLTSPYSVGPVVIDVPVSIGTAVYPADGMQLDELIQKADVAMYRDKAGRLAQACAGFPAAARSPQ